MRRKHSCPKLKAYNYYVKAVGPLIEACQNCPLPAKQTKFHVFSILSGMENTWSLTCLAGKTAHYYVAILFDETLHLLIVAWFVKSLYEVYMGV